VEKASENGQVIRMHSPISPQCSQWAKEDSRTPEELLQNLEEYMTALCERYNGNENIVWMDVVNETLDKNTGEWFGPKPGTDKWENPWTIIGFDTTVAFKPPLYIKRAFEIATEKAPDIKHIINQHGTVDDIVWDKIKELVFYLRDKGLQVDGVGFQAHVDAGWEKENDNLEKLAGLIDWAHQNDLEFHITENNVFLRNGNEGNWEAQAETFKAILETVISRRETGVVTWNVWMIRDGDGQQSARTPVLFFDDGEAKLAYYAVQEILEEAPTGIESEEETVADNFILYNNYPNPFNPSTNVDFYLPASAFVSLTIHNVLGEKIETLVNGEVSVGRHSFIWNAKSASGVQVASGIYIARLKIGAKILTTKMLFLK
jgi:GH35 family endo-1,4-beta-xylanase